MRPFRRPGARWHEWEVLSETAREIVSIRREIRTIIELLARIDDLVAAQRDVGELLN